jgi:hypothetical protein
MEVNNSQVEEITRHHRYTLDELESLLQSLRMELEVAPTDHKAHHDLFHRIIGVAERGLEPPDPNDYINIDDPTLGITIVEDQQEFDSEIGALRQQGWKIMTVTQVAQTIEQQGVLKSDVSSS